MKLGSMFRDAGEVISSALEKQQTLLGDLEKSLCNREYAAVAPRLLKDRVKACLTWTKAGGKSPPRSLLIIPLLDVGLLYRKKRIGA